MRKLIPNSPATSTAGDSVSRALTRALAILPSRVLPSRSRVSLYADSAAALSGVSIAEAMSAARTRDVRERLALELVQMARDPLVDAVGQQQHLQAARAKALEVRAVARRRERIGGQVVDALLVRLHARTRSPQA